MHLVTGATGIVGSHVLLECAVRGPVRALYRGGSDRSIVERVFRHYRADADVLLTAIEWVEADILDVDALWAAMRGVRHVFHTAAVVSFSPRDADRMHRVNVTGTANVVNAALENGIERLCHVSSTAAIGEEPAGVARTESSPWHADERTSAYSLSKYAAEMEVYRGIAEGLDAILVNPCVIIGPGQEGRSSMTLVERLRKGTRFHPPGSNAVVDARDVAQAMLALMEKAQSGERFLLVGENITYKRLFGLLAAAFGNPAPAVPLRPWMLGLGWRLEALRGFVTGSEPFITRATAWSALSHRSYSSAKAEALLGLKFRKAKEAVSNVAAFVAGRSAH
jgi:dihydroflavonol-4-reductase